MNKSVFSLLLDMMSGLSQYRFWLYLFFLFHFLWYPGGIVSSLFFLSIHLLSRRYLAICFSYVTYSLILSPHCTVRACMMRNRIPFFFLVFSLLVFLLISISRLLFLPSFFLFLFSWTQGLYLQRCHDNRTSGHLQTSAFPYFFLSCLSFLVLIRSCLF